MEIMEIHSQPIELCNVLKLHGLVSSGGMAKAEIAAGQVRVNGTIETRKRKKIVSGDVVEYAGTSIRILLEGQS
jgi:ribosome-associated protein